MGVVLPEIGSSCIVVVPTALVCDAPTAGAAFESTFFFFPDLVMAVISSVDGRLDSDGLAPVSTDG